MHGYKRIVALSLALVAVAARRFNIDPEMLAILLDLAEAVLALGLGGHVAGVAVRNRRLSRKIAKIGAVLALAGCSVVDLEACKLQVSRSDAARDRLVCANHEPIRVPRLDPILRACVLAPPLPVTP